MEKNMIAEKNTLNSSDIIAWLKGVNKSDLPDFPLAFYGYIKQLEDREYWAIGNKTQAFGKIKSLAERLNDSSLIQELALSPESYPEILKLLAYIHYGPSLRLLSLFNHHQNGITNELLSACKKGNLDGMEKEVKLFLTRIKLIVNRECFLDIFSKESRGKTIEILKELKEKGEI